MPESPLIKSHLNSLDPDDLICTELHSLKYIFYQDSWKTRKISMKETEKKILDLPPELDAHTDWMGSSLSSIESFHQVSWSIS